MPGVDHRFVQASGGLTPTARLDKTMIDAPPDNDPAQPTPALQGASRCEQPTCGRSPVQFWVRPAWGAPPPIARSAAPAATAVARSTPRTARSAPPPGGPAAPRG